MNPANALSIGNGFLSVGERRLLGDKVTVAFRALGGLWVGSTASSASHLVEGRASRAEKAPPISKRCSHEMTLVLLRFHFVYADFIQSLLAAYVCFRLP
jgi:hypothetical protein